MTKPTREHVAGLQYALDSHLIGDLATRHHVESLISQAKAAPEPVQGEAVDVRGIQWLDTGHYRKNPPKYGYNPHDWNPLMTVAQHNRIRAAVKPEGWRAHSVKYAKGEKCPETIETLQAAWDRDQELIDDQRKEIASLKQKLNQARQSNAKPDAELVELLRQCRNDFAGISMTHDLVGRIDAKLAELRK